MSDAGVDVLTGLLLTHRDGAVSLLSATLSSDASDTAVVEGSRGSVRLEAPLWNPSAMTVRSQAEGVARGSDRVLRPAVRGAGYVPMLEHVQDCLRGGLTESPLHPLGTTLAVTEVLGQALAQLGVARPDEKAPASRARS